MSSRPETDLQPDRADNGGHRADGVLALGRGVELPRTERTPVPDLVARYARTQPGHVAVRGAGEAISYRELDGWAGRIAARLSAAGVVRGGRVAVLVEPSTAMVAAVLGVARAGAAYVPVDLTHPDQRIAEVLTDAEVTAAVVTAGSGPRLAGLRLPRVLTEESAPGREGAGPGPAPPAVPLTPEDPAYVIHTSGSTGEPKGVLVGHGELTASTLARHAVHPGAPTFLLLSPLAFDSSVAGLWGTLTAGGSLVVATPDEVRDPERLVELIQRHEVTRLLCVPSLYRVVLDAAERLGPERLGSLDTVIVAGEALPETLLRRHFRVHPGSVTLVNEYGPTETTVWASYRRFAAPGRVSVGGSVPGVRLYVLDARLRPVPRGSEGELYVGGAGVARGYVGRPAATAHTFVADPFAGTPGARMYRTGDRVRWHADGTLDFLGRRDHQVKIRGHRVELGAVEEALRAVPGVRDAAVVPDDAHTTLTGFVLAAADTAPEEVRARLAARLPAAAVPARIEVRDDLPRTVNGKVDRALLRADAAPAPSAAPATAPPAGADGTGADTGDVAARVSAAWAEVLRASDVPREVNFFDLGGHSLTMFELQDALERHTGTRPSVVALFRHTTVAAQAELIRDSGPETDTSRPDARAASARRARAMRARRQRVEQEAAR